MTEKERQKTEEASLKGPDMAQRQDPLAPYLKEEASRFVFDVLSQDYLASSGLDFMAEVPIPLTLEDLTAFQEGGLPLVQLADNMTLLLGLDPAFPSAGAYLRFLVKDEPGVIAAVSETLAEAGVSIECFLQKPVENAEGVPIVLTSRADTAETRAGWVSVAAEVEQAVRRLAD